MPPKSPKPKVDAANSRMLVAWREGRELLDRLGPRAGYGAMMDASKENSSEAERIRKLRSLALRMTEREVHEICQRCKKAERAWGPQYLIALSRVAKATERKKLVTLALRERMGLKELQRRVRVHLSETGVPARHNRRGAGRRRTLDWRNAAVIRDEIERMALSWLHLFDELQLAAMDQELSDPLSLLPRQMRQEFCDIVDLAEKLVDSE